MAQTFDYVRAFLEVASPAYDALPDRLRTLFKATHAEARELHQKHDLTMPWPDDPGLRQTFEDIGSDDLALAAHVIHAFGHWNPGGLFDADETRAGSHWKFSHYADQVLRARFGLTRESDRPGWGLALIEGMILITYASLDMRTWREVAPATDAGFTHAQSWIEKARRAVPVRGGGRAAANRDTLQETDAAASTFLEAIPLMTPEPWAPWFEVSKRYMVAEGEAWRLETLTPADKAATFAKRRAKLKRSHDVKVEKARREFARMDWLLAREQSTDNAIYYDHTDTVCFGWRTPVSEAERGRLLDLLCEYPYAYEIKTADPALHISTRAKALVAEDR